MQSEPQTTVPEQAKADPSAGAADGGGDSNVEVPSTAIGDAKEGDTVQFTVVSRDDENGGATLAPNGPEAPEAGGSDDMAEEFGKDQMRQP